jgi:hypothetical protein
LWAVHVLLRRPGSQERGRIEALAYARYQTGTNAASHAVLRIHSQKTHADKKLVVAANMQVEVET